MVPNCTQSVALTFFSSSSPWSPLRFVVSAFLSTIPFRANQAMEKTRGERFFFARAWVGTTLPECWPTTARTDSIQVAQVHNTKAHPINQKQHKHSSQQRRRNRKSRTQFRWNKRPARKSATFGRDVAAFCSTSNGRRPVGPVAQCNTK